MLLAPPAEGSKRVNDSSPKMASEDSVAMADDIIRVTTYHRRDKDEKVITFRSVEHDKIKDCIGRSFTTANNTWWSEGLGRLQVLPTELLLKIFLDLDIESLFKLLHVNGRSREVVTGIFEWRAISKHALDALLALFRTGMAKYTTLPQLYRPLTEKWCVTCGEYGGFLFIPTMMRCCLKCIYDDVQFPVMTLNSVAKRNKISLKALRRACPLLKTIPGWYGRYELGFMQRLTYVSFQHALEALETFKGPDAPEVEKFIAYGISNVEQQPYDKCKASTIIPTFDPTTETAYWGLSCKACCAEGLGKLGRVRHTDELPAALEKIYSREEFLEHFKSCEKAKDMWKASEGGTKDISHLESRFSINGGFNPQRMVADGAWAF